MWLDQRRLHLCKEETSWMGVVILHETVHKLDPKKLNGVILNINFEKVYDKVKWSFLQRTLRMKGFSEEWCALIYSSCWTVV
jgi:hypothetical protein